MTPSLSPRNLEQFSQPPREFSLLPFWFWNDDLQEAELLRQMDDFEAHGVYGFVIHPRVGLPKHLGWMSERLLQLMRFVVEEAARRQMTVVLYDEGMYPSGSSSGQVVEENPLYAVRGLDSRVLAADEAPQLSPGEELVAVTQNRRGERVLVFDRPFKSVIRGLHYIGEGPAEETPPAADLLNPDAMACFVRKVYERCFAELGDHFGSTIIGIFTDEPMLLGRPQEKGIKPGTTGILEHVNRILGYDFTPHLPALWDEEEPEAEKYRADYERAVHQRLEETYYAPLQQWCEAHGTQLMGHPAEPGDLGMERYFHIPGQDIVWRWVLPNHPSALEGPESTQAKCSSSAMLHLGRRRNSNECFGAYGHELTFEETQWLVNWCLVRGVNMFFPHAFYYSIRGPRFDERPPDVGPHSAWWGEYASFAAYCRRLCWLNTDSEPVCRVAILGEGPVLPWETAKICFENQRDFNYLETRDLWERAGVSASGIEIGAMRYDVLIVDDAANLPAEAQPALNALAEAGRLVLWKRESQWPGAVTVQDASGLVAAIDAAAAPDVTISPACPELRVRHLRKNGDDFYLLFNEGAAAIEFSLQTAVPGRRLELDAVSGSVDGESDGTISLPAYGTKLFCIPAN